MHCCANRVKMNSSILKKIKCQSLDLTQFIIASDLRNRYF